MTAPIAYAAIYGATTKSVDPIADGLRKRSFEAPTLPKARKATLTSKPVTAFITASGILSRKEPGSAANAPITSGIENHEAKTLGECLHPLLAKPCLEPQASAASGGHMVMSGKDRFNNRDPESIKAWAAALARKVK